MSIALFALMMVIVLDVMGQGLVIPVLTTLIVEPSQTLLDSDTSTGTRQFYFGLTMAVFFLSWFLGAAYISKLSDSIGRKQGILICLSGALTGYVLTILALHLNSFTLLLISRMITGFTAGNQPIAQAALVDISANEDEKTRNMGFVLVAVSIGLVIGPILGGVLSDPSVLGSIASIELPFYAAALLVIVNIALILVFFENRHDQTRPITIKLTDVFLTLYHASQRPVVLRLSIVFFCSQLALNSFFVFVDNYLLSKFNFSTLQNSVISVIFGITMALSAGFLVGPFASRFRKFEVISGTLIIMAFGVLVFILNPIPGLSYILIIPFVVAFGVNYPLMITLFSASVDETEQGWVMGVTVALYTLGAGLISLFGGQLMSLDIRWPFFISMASLVLAMIFVVLLWRDARVRALNARGQD